MNTLSREQRAAVNVEYILLLVVGALAVVLGLSYLSTVMNDKHVQVAEALSVATTATEPTVPMVVNTPTQNAGGTYLITWDGGVPPFTVYQDGVAVGTVNDGSVTVAPYGVPTTYAIHDSAAHTHEVVITTSLSCTDCHTMTDLSHTQHASLSCTSDCHTACRDLTTALQGDPLCETCHAPAMP